MEGGVSEGSRLGDDADVKRRRDERNNPRASNDIVAARVGASRGRRASSEAVRRARTAAGKFSSNRGKAAKKGRHRNAPSTWVRPAATKSAARR